MDDDVRLDVTFDTGSDTSPREMDDLTLGLRRELLQLDVTAVDRVSAGLPPDGARGVDLAALGALVVSFGKATPVLGQVVAVLQAWSARNSNRTAKLTLEGDTLEVGGLSEQEQNRLIEQWMARHSVAPASDGTGPAPAPGTPPPTPPAAKPSTAS